MIGTLRNILDGWPRRWRYPDLMASLARSAAEDPGGAGLVRGLLGGLAAPRTPREACDALLERGEFLVAEVLLETAEFLAGLADEAREDLLDRLASARRQALEAVQRRTALLEVRAHRAGMEGPAPAAVESRLTDAEAELGAWGDRIRAREEELALAQRAALAEQAGRHPEARAWAEAVERCIGARAFEAARFLLAGGPQLALAADQDPAAVVRLPRWPWAYPLRETLPWFRDEKTAPPGFQARWRPAADDAAAAAVVAALIGLDGHRADAPRTAEFAAALDALLDDDGDPRRQAKALAGGFETRLRALDDPRLPCLALADRDGVRLWVAGRPDAPPPDNPPERDVLLCFYPEAPPAARPGTIPFDAWALLRLLADRRHRRVHLLRELGRRVDLADAVPRRVERVRLPGMSPAEVRAYAAWLLDVLNVGAEAPFLADEMISYTGARPRLLLRLLRALLAAAGRRAPVTVETLSRAWESPTFRDEAGAELLAPLAENPAARVVLAAMLAALADQEDATRSRVPVLLNSRDVQVALACWVGGIPEAAVRDNLGWLVRRDFIEAAPGENYRVPRSGVGQLLRDAFGDPELCLIEAREGPAGREGESG